MIKRRNAYETDALHRCHVRDDLNRCACPGMDGGKGGLTMYRVTIQLEHGCKVEFVESSILRAAARVGEYHGMMESCEITRIEGGEDNSGGKVDQDSY